ncbi:hypothetical protein IT397_03500 [Candidatus Nomurabacteria bacterium]|nr:hypothetical protein [Candidatus Nomurabacteria bacterium]
MPKERLYCAFAFNVHDSSVSFAIENKVILVLEAERIFKQKKKRCDLAEMEFLINTGLKYLGKKLEDIAGWAMTTLNNPFLTRNDIVDEKTTFPKEPYAKEITILGISTKALVVNHHLSHAATYLFSEFNQAIITTCDGGGDHDPKIGIGECFAVYRGDGNDITRYYDIDSSELITGKTYATCAVFIYNAKPCEGKLMALAAFGKVKEEYLEKLKALYRKIETVDYPIGEKILEENFQGLRGTASGNNPSEEAKDFCATVQFFFSEQRVKNTISIVDKIYKENDNFVLAGGTGLNLDLNSLLLKELPKMHHYIAPCCDDTGQSLGALSMLIVKETGLRPEVRLPYLGMGEENIPYKLETISKVSDILNKDGIVVLHNGKAEIGPRALGNRSLIGRADSIVVKKKLSEEIKPRESYRPVAPVTIEERVNDYFVGPHSSPFMLYKYDVLEPKKNEIEGAIHYDESARVQTITKESNAFLYDLIKAYGEKTGTYVLLNTSLNLKGDPIANTLEDSLKIYEKITGPKVLVYNGNIEKTND